MKQVWKIAAILALLAAAGAWVYLSQQVPAPVEMAKVPVPADAGQPPSLEQGFEKTLNDFVAQMDEKARDYRRSRKVLTELVRSENLRSPEYIEQNAALMRETIPALRQKIDELMLIFEQAEVSVVRLLEGQPDEVSAPIRSKWDALRKDKVALYVDFFSVEEEILDVYGQLMDFYVSKKSAFSVDPSAKTLSFADAADAAAEEGFRARLRDLSQRQSAVLGASE